MSEGRSRLKSVCAVLGCVTGLQVAAAQADSCTKSRDYILASSLENMPRPQRYQQLYKSCLETLELSNVKDAFVLKSGAIAVLPHNSSVPATAGTLAQFCRRFPQLTLRFITRRERRLVRNVARVVRLSTSKSTPCQKISGGG